MPGIVNLNLRLLACVPLMAFQFFPEAQSVGSE